MTKRPSGRFRLAVVASHPVQYQAPWFAALAGAVDLEVLYCHRQDAAGQAAAGFGQAFEWDVPLFEGYQFRWLQNVARQPSVDVFSGCNTPEIGRVLDAGHFDACLVNGWYLRSYVQAIRACRRRGLPVLVRGDSQLNTPRARMTRLAKYLPYRWFLSRIDAHLYVGRANHAYLRHYGVRPQRLFFAPHFVDTDRFAAAAARARAEGSTRARRTALGIVDDEVAFVFVGKLIAKKRPLDFVRAVSLLHRQGLPVHGMVVGSGPLEDELRRYIAESGAPVHLLGFHNQTQLPWCYASAECLVLPSDGGETWGLVVNEAMACGLPAIVSDAVGCADDMITEGATGFTFPCGDVTALADRMRTFVSLRAIDRDGLTEAVTDRVASYSCERAVEGTLEALAFAVADHTVARPHAIEGSRA